MPESLVVESNSAARGQSVVDVALIGNPNSGKSSVFNALTGMRQKVANYPGVTVEKKTGSIRGNNGHTIRLHDLPGMYSLVPKSLDDKIASDIITGRSQGLENLRLNLIVVDAGNLNRSLFLVTQVIELGVPTLLVLNMMDEALAKGLKIRINSLSKALGIPVVPVIANRGRGIPKLRRKIIEMISSDPKAIVPPAGLALEGDIKEAAAPICSWLQKNTPVRAPASCSEALRVLSSDKALAQWSQGNQGQLSEIVSQSRRQLNSKNIEWQMLETKRRYQWIDEVCQKAVREAEKEKPSTSEKADRILTHRIAGPLIFVFIFAVIFESIFSWAEIPMTAVENSVNWLGNMVENLLPGGVLADLIVNGAIAGVGAILVFLPQIMFLFFFLSLLEDSGYMARVAFMLDRVMRPLGLSGRSVIPMLSSFACAIPGIMATRTIQNWHERLVTIMIAPLMTCSARLPVYTLMIAAFIPNITILGIFSLAGLTLLSMYLLGILAAMGAGIVMTRFLGTGKKKTSFVMELPAYRRPSLKWTSLKMIERARIFVTEAGKIILAISIVLWFLASYPKADPSVGLAPGEAIKQSYAGQLGHFIEPAIAPLGFDWKMGIGVITSFAAREVLVSTMATIYNVEGADENSASLRETLRNERDPETGEPVYTPLVAISMMVFFAFACQCMSTVAIVRRETNSWRWPITMVAYMSVLAYLGSLLVFQGGKLLGLG